jgi:hypothetical protein
MSVDRYGNAVKRRRTKQAKAQAARDASARKAAKGTAAEFTPEQIRQRKAGHAAYLHASIEAIGTAEGMARFLEARELNPHLTPLACASVAMDAPGRVVGTAHWWTENGYRIRKGEQARVFGTKAPSFNPLPMFTDEQLAGELEWDVDAQLLELEPIPPSLIDAAREALAAAVADGKSPAQAVKVVAL